MTTKIRQGVFETNSSSTHSICIAKDAELNIPEKLHFGFGEFGWELKTLQSCQDKASYLYTGLIYNKREKDAYKIFELLKRQGINVDVEEPIFATRGYFNKEGAYIAYTAGQNTGYVDHGDQLAKFLDSVCEDESKLMRYLFSELSFIIAGNDNEDHDVEIKVTYPRDEYYKGN